MDWGHDGRRVATLDRVAGKAVRPERGGGWPATRKKRGQWDSEASSAGNMLVGAVSWRVSGEQDGGGEGCGEPSEAEPDLRGLERCLHLIPVKSRDLSRLVESGWQGQKGSQDTPASVPTHRLHT